MFCVRVTKDITKIDCYLGQSRLMSSIKILHVDDDSESLEITKYYLTRESDVLDIDWACDIPEAMKLLSKTEYDCILCDYRLRSEGGIDLVEKTRARGIDTPVILFTGFSRSEVENEALGHDNVYYAQKEVGVENFRKLLDNIITRAAEHKKKKS